MANQAELSKEERYKEFQKIIDLLMSYQWKTYMRFLGTSENQLHNHLVENHDKHQMLKSRQEKIGKLTHEVVELLGDVRKEVTSKERNNNVDLKFRTKKELKQNRNAAWVIYDFTSFYTGDNWSNIATSKLFVQNMLQIQKDYKSDENEQKFQMVLIWRQGLDLEDDENCNKLVKAIQDLDISYAPTNYIGDDSIDAVSRQIQSQPGAENEAGSSGYKQTLPDAGDILRENIPDKATKLPTIMISYCWANEAEKKIARKIEADLKQKGYKTWIDINDMRGSTKQCAYKGVESCDIFLPCISEKYFQSGPCEEEAKLARERNKRIIPICVEKGFKATEWLKMVTRDTFYYSFFDGKYPFDKLMKDIREGS